MFGQTNNFICIMAWLEGNVNSDDDVQWCYRWGFWKSVSCVTLESLLTYLIFCEILAETCVLVYIAWYSDEFDKKKKKGWKKPNENTKKISGNVF